MIFGWVAAVFGLACLTLAAGYGIYYLIEWMETRWPQR